MKKTLLYIATIGILTGSLVFGTPGSSYAAPEESTAAETIAETTEAEETTTAQTAETQAVAEETEAAETAAKQTTEAAEDTDEEDDEQLAETDDEAASEDEGDLAETSDLRQSVVNYALSFVGGKYRAGGNDPHTGVDCSGFVKYILQNGAGVSMNRSSSSQASQGVAISAAQMQPGDLLFYGSGRSINHVAMYIGDGRIVHASTYKTGIKTSVWNYRTPVKIVSMLG